MDIYLDENLSEYVADALNFLNKGYYPDIQVYSTKTKIRKGATDEEIIPTLGAAGNILITRDISIQKTRLQYLLCQQYLLGIFFLKLPKNQNKHWEIVKLLINNWEEIVEKSNKERKPFGYIISPRGKMEKL